MVVLTFSAALTAVLLPSGIVPPGGVVLVMWVFPGTSTTELQAALCTVVTAAPQLFSCDHSLCRSGKIVRQDFRLSGHEKM